MNLPVSTECYFIHIHDMLIAEVSLKLKDKIKVMNSGY